MLRVALTGGAASGKSAVAATLRQMGAFVSQSDEVGRALMQPGQAVYDSIVRRFGPTVVRADGSLHRPELARLAFTEGRLGELNAIVHPPVIAAQTAWLEQRSAEHPCAVAVVESALVLETPFGTEAGQPWRDRFDVVVLVVAPPEDRMKRYVARVLAADSSANVSSATADANARFAAQMPDTEKRLLAHFVVENDGSLELLQHRAADLYAHLLRLAQAHGGEPM